MAINKISGNILADALIRGADISIGSVADNNLLYFDIGSNRVGVRTNSPTEDFEINGVFLVGNVSISNVGNIDAGNVYINNLADPVANQDGATKFYVDGRVDPVIANLGNIYITDTTISPTYSPANITLAPTGSSTLIINTTSGMVLPTGNTAQRPSPAATGTVRFNNELARVEVYDGVSWADIVANITAQTLNGDGSTTVFTLDRDSTTASTLVIINGLVQLPTTAYTISGNQLTFTQAPVVSDVIDIRFL